MTKEAEQGFENVAARLGGSLQALQSRSSWSSPREQESLLVIMRREVQDFGANRDLFVCAQEISPGNTLVETMTNSLQRIAITAVEPGAGAELALWELVDNWMLNHRGFLESLNYHITTSSGPRVDLPDEISRAIPAALGQREEARSTFDHLQRIHSEDRLSKQQEDLLAYEAELAAADDKQRELSALAARKGDKALSDEFSKMAHNEASTAFGWTALSIVTTAVGIVLGVIAHFDIFETPEAKLLYPVLVAVGAAGVAAYFARIGGHHRHSAQWAKSIAVQLDSYEQFVRHTDDPGRIRVFDQFAGRVLGAPPPRSEKAAVQTATIADIAAIVARNPT